MTILQPTDQSLGLSTYRNLSLSTTGQVVKSSPAQLYGYYFYNNAAATRYVKLYDKATAPTNADTPILTIALPAGAAANVFSDVGLTFHAGLSARACQGVLDNDNTAPSANDVVINLFYK
jgi:hypothetical protein